MIGLIADECTKTATFLRGIPSDGAAFVSHLDATLRGVFEDLAIAVKEVGAADPHAFSDAELSEALVELQRLRSSLEPLGGVAYPGRSRPSVLQGPLG